METIIDLYELPSSSDYAYWAYDKSGVEKYWYNFDEFQENYETAKNSISLTKSFCEEYDIVERITYVVNHNKKIGNDLKLDVVSRLNNTYWKNYKSKCFIQNNVIESLNALSKKYKLSIISNFKVKNGIEELLDEHKIKYLFDFVVTSIDFGWRKPDTRIYKYALKLSRCEPNEVVFIGDDYENDYVIPRQLGMKSLLLNKEKYYDNKDSITSFLDIERKLDELK